MSSHQPSKTAPVIIIGTGRYNPAGILTNAELEKRVDTSDEWITTRTGIKERRIAAPGEHNSDMATKTRTIEIDEATAAALQRRADGRGARSPAQNSARLRN